MMYFYALGFAAVYLALQLPIGILIGRGLRRISDQSHNN